MKAIKVTVGKEESLKISPFIDMVNENEDSAAYQIDEHSFMLTTVNECLWLFQMSIFRTFEKFNTEIIK